MQPGQIIPKFEAFIKERYSDKLFDSIKKELTYRESKQRPSIFLYGQRRIGKTSVLFQISNGELGDKFIPVKIDMQEVGNMDTYDFLNFLTKKMQKELKKAGIITKSLITGTCGSPVSLQ